MSKGRFPLWTLLGVVLVVALIVGSGVLRSSSPTASQRADAIESALRCPSCEDLSVAQSSAATAVTVRATVVQQIAQGRTNQQIENYLVARYGSSIVLDPPASGWSLLIWLLPLLGGLAALAVLAKVLLSRRNATELVSDPSPSGRPLSPEAAADRRRFLTQSLEDADAEYLAGDLSDRDYLALRRRDMARLATLGVQKDGAGDGGGNGAAATTVLVEERTLPVDAAVAGPAEAPPAAQPKRRLRRSWWFLGGAVAAFAAALILSVFLFASDRQPGQSITGSFAESQQQQIEESLGQAASSENAGDPTEATQLYQSVLAKQPDNEVALAQLGWIEFQTGQQTDSASLLSDARSKLDRAVALDPGDYAVRLYLGTMALQQEDDFATAVAEYRQFLADKPPASLVKQAAPVIRDAFQQAGDPLPGQVPAT